MQGGRSIESLRRKLFVGGLSFKTTSDSMREYFSKFGNIEDAIVMTFPESQRSRGFGFVTYATDEEVENCQNNRPHVIDGKQVETKRATPREARENPEACQSVTKVFVGGIPEEVEDEEIQAYFEQFGKVTSVKRATDKDTGKKKRFAFVEFADYDDVDKAIIKGNHELGGRHIDVKKAVPKEAMGGGGGGGGRGGRGGRGGGRGGWGGGRGYQGGGGQWGGAASGGGWGQSAGGWGGGYQSGGAAADGWGGASSDYSSYQSGGAASWGSTAGYGASGEDANVAGYGTGGYGGGPIRPTAGAAGGYRTTPYGGGAAGGYQAAGAGRGGSGYRGGMA